MRNIQWRKLLQSWWGRLLAGAFIGALLVAFSGLDQPIAYLAGMAIGAVALFLLGRWK